MPKAKAKRVERRPLRFDCLTFKQAGKVLVLFACNAKTLSTIVQVNQREEDSSGGYQRVLSEARVAKIASFVDAGNYIPTSVLLSFDHASLSADRTELIVENRKDAGWVIDGQHRIVGGNAAETNILLPVVAFTDLDIDSQISCFVTINREQKGVSSSLYLELLKSLPANHNPNEDARRRAIDLAQQLKINEDSPFFGKIVSTTSPGKGRLSLTNFVRKVQPMMKLNGGCLSPFNDENKGKILDNYYKALRNVFPTEYENSNSVFFKTIGFGALMGALPAFLNTTLTSCGGRFRVTDASTIFNRMADFDFSAWKGISSSARNPRWPSNCETRSFPTLPQEAPARTLIWTNQCPLTRSIGNRGRYSSATGTTCEHFGSNTSPTLTFRGSHQKCFYVTSKGSRTYADRFQEIRSSRLRSGYPGSGRGYCTRPFSFCIKLHMFWGPPSCMCLTACAHGPFQARITHRFLQ